MIGGNIANQCLIDNLLLCNAMIQDSKNIIDPKRKLFNLPSGVCFYTSPMLFTRGSADLTGFRAQVLQSWT